jgi:hypothetical protein
MRFILTSILFLTLTGCSSLIVRNYDDPVVTTGKVTARVLLAVPTLGISEGVIARVKEDEWREGEERAYRSWYANLSPQEQAIERQRQHERDLATRQAVGMMLPMQMYNTQQSLNTMRMTPPAPLTMPAVQPPRPLNCTSYPIGDHLYTNCY